MMILIVVSTDTNQFEEESTQILKNCILWCLNWFYQIKLEPFLFFCSALLNNLQKVEMWGGGHFEGQVMPKVMFLASLKFLSQVAHSLLHIQQQCWKIMLQHQSRLKGKMSSLTKNTFALVPIIQIFSDFENCFTGNTRNVVVIQQI